MATQDNSRREQLISDQQGIYQSITADHRKVESLFDELASVGGDEERIRELYRALKREIMLHTNVEDRTVYTPLEANDQFESAIEYSREEHQEVDALLLELDNVELGSQEFMEKADELRQALEAHMEKEETEILPSAFDVIDESDSRQMARDYESEKETELTTLVETEPGLSAIDEENLDELSRDDLAELARRRDIEGRSSMSKDELAQALRQRQ